MANFRKKPVVIEAVQWNGNNLIEVVNHMGGIAHAYKWDEYEYLVSKEGLKISTLEGVMNADVGDWIIKGVKGEFYPCKNDIFLATYESCE